MPPQQPARFRSTFPEPVQELVWRSLLQEREHAIVLLDPDGVILAWPPGAEKLFGWRAQEMLGQPLDRLFTPEDIELQAVRHERDIAIATGVGENDRWLMRRDGSRIWVTGATSTLRLADGTVCGFCKIMRDRTDLRSLVGSLENRTAELAATLEQSRVFAAMLVHELRNPVGALSNGLEIIRMAAGHDARVQRALEIYERQLGAMRRLLEDVTDSVRAETGKLKLDVRPMAVNELLHSAEATVLPRVHNKSQQLQLLPLPVSSIVRVDPLRMQQVLVNLLDNAVKYTPAGGHIWLKASTEGRDVVIRVVDDGVGMDEQVLPRVFDLFTQAAHAGSGLGLGLTLVRQLVELHGGSVQARSSGHGQGSEFSVRLPIHHPAQ